MKIWVNGVESLTVSASDRGLQYGDGLFETMKIVEGRIPLLNKHLDRLVEGCRRLAFPTLQTDVLKKEISHAARGAQRGVLKLIVTRGDSQRGYRVGLNSTPTRILYLSPWPENIDHLQRHGVALWLCTSRVARNPMLAGLKHLNRLENVLARAEWDDEQYHDGLLLDTDDNVVEVTSGNLFIARDRRLLTPRLDYCGVSGIMRQEVLDAAKRAAIECEITNISLNDVKSADELFVTNAIVGMIPVNSIRNLKTFDKSRSIMSEIQAQFE